MNTNRLACGCTDTERCPEAQRLSVAWDKASKIVERLYTGGNEYAQRKAYEAYARHFDPTFSAPPRAPGVR